MPVKHGTPLLANGLSRPRQDTMKTRTSDFDLSDQDTGMKYPLDWKCELMYASEECYEGEPADEISSKTTGKN